MWGLFKICYWDQFICASPSKERLEQKRQDLLRLGEIAYQFENDQYSKRRELERKFTNGEISHREWMEHYHDYDARDKNREWHNADLEIREIDYYE